MTPLPDRVVIVAMVCTIGVCFALVLWTVKLNPRLELPMQWRDAPAAERLAWPAGDRGRLL